MILRAWVSLSLCVCALSAAAGPDDFHAGNVIPDYGKVATVTAAASLPSTTQFSVAFDVGEAAEEGQVNRRMASAARLINMHEEAGIDPDNTRVAIVVHGSAALDLVNDERFGGPNPNAGLIAALTKAGVRIILCGQTAAYRDVAAADLLDGVSMSLSAMTAHALLQQQGYTLNPF
ncbi:MAG: DsrE family protein [Gammaproteobacteria bacterium]